MSNISDSAENTQTVNLLKEIVSPLLGWFDKNARVLPWRENPTPYRVWVSEIMLQQTRVEAVKPYFERFMETIPDIASLAKIEEEVLLKLWEGLGYYNRARNLKKTAQILADQYESQLPSEFHDLITLPGIGSYTAGAISSIAYGKPYPAVDGNVLRVISRVTASYDDVLKQSVKRRMEENLQVIMPRERAGAFNQAIMEIGATICVPNGLPKCEECPLLQLCRANSQGIAMELPRKTQKKPRQMEDRTVLLLISGNQVLIRKRVEKGLLSGLYEFPNESGHWTKEEVEELVKGMSFKPLHIQELENAKHIFTHREWHMTGYLVEIDKPDHGVSSDYFLAEYSEIEKKYAIPSAFERYLRYIKNMYNQPYNGKNK